MSDEAKIAWDKWIIHHLTLFGKQRSADWIETVDSWRQVFAPAGYTADELTEASNWIAIHNPPTWPAEHLAALMSRLHTQRQDQVRKYTQEPEDRGTCVGCGNSGLVVVPHWKCMVGGVWVTTRGVYYEMMVLCHCYFGRRLMTQHPEWVTIMQYEMAYPMWKDAWKRRWAELNEYNKAMSAARQKHSMGDVFSKLLQRHTQGARDGKEEVQSQAGKDPQERRETQRPA